MTSLTNPQAPANPGAQAAQHALDELTRAAHPDRVFGQPVERGDVTLIPCCELALGMGMGSGSGQNPASDRAPSSTGQGAGGGGGMRGRPVAAIVIARDTVNVVPIVDATRVALAALTTAGFMAFWITRLTTAARAQSPDPMLPAAPRLPTLRGLLRGIGQ